MLLKYILNEYNQTKLLKVPGLFYLLDVDYFTSCFRYFKSNWMFGQNLYFYKNHNENREYRFKSMIFK